MESFSGLFDFKYSNTGSYYRKFGTICGDIYIYTESGGPITKLTQVPLMFIALLVTICDQKIKLADTQSVPGTAIR